MGYICDMKWMKKFIVLFFPGNRTTFNVIPKYACVCFKEKQKMHHAWINISCYTLSMLEVFSTLILGRSSCSKEIRFSFCVLPSLLFFVCVFFPICFDRLGLCRVDNEVSSGVPWPSWKKYFEWSLILLIQKWWCDR